MTCRTEDGVTYKQEYNSETCTELACGTKRCRSDRIASIIRLARRKGIPSIGGDPSNLMQSNGRDTLPTPRKVSDYANLIFPTRESIHRRHP
jgi:hypothetical protein